MLSAQYYTIIPCNLMLSVNAMRLEDNFSVVNFDSVPPAPDVEIFSPLCFLLDCIPTKQRNIRPCGIGELTINHARDVLNQCRRIAGSVAAPVRPFKSTTASSQDCCLVAARPNSPPHRNIPNVTRSLGALEDEFIIGLDRLSFIICGGIWTQQLFRMNCGIKGNYVGSLISGRGEATDDGCGSPKRQNIITYLISLS